MGNSILADETRLDLSRESVQDRVNWSTQLGEVPETMELLSSTPNKSHQHDNYFQSSFEPIGPDVSVVPAAKRVVDPEGALAKTSNATLAKYGPLSCIRVVKAVPRAHEMSPVFPRMFSGANTSTKDRITITKDFGEDANDIGTLDSHPTVAQDMPALKLCDGKDGNVRVPYKYAHSPVRGKLARAKLVGYTCLDCYKFYRAAKLDDKAREALIQKCSKHRALFPPKSLRSPEEPWKMVIESDEEKEKTQTCTPVRGKKYHWARFRERQMERLAKKKSLLFVEKI